MISRRALLSALPLLVPTPAWAQNFPTGQVRIIVPFPPGGATDVLGRVLAGGQGGAFDVTRELAPVSLIAAPPYILVVNPAVPGR